MKPIRNPWVWRLSLVASLLYLVASWQQPTKRTICLSLGVFFGIVAVQQRRRTIPSK